MQTQNDHCTGARSWRSNKSEAINWIFFRCSFWAFTTLILSYKHLERLVVHRCEDRKNCDGVQLARFSGGPES
eukprot:764506-Hanusia_phi.AAC.3